MSVKVELFWSNHIKHRGYVLGLNCQKKLFIVRKNFSRYFKSSLCHWKNGHLSPLSNKVLLLQDSCDLIVCITACFH